MQRHDIQFPAKDAALREDVHELGALVGEVLREQGGEELFALVEGDRIAAIRRREGDPEGALELKIAVQERPPALARDLARAFSTWFQVVNLAEKVHRIRRRRQYFVSATAPQPTGVEDALMRLKEQGASLEQVVRLLETLRIEPVFTAHPTESTRRTILRKQQRIAQLLLSRMDPSATPQEQRGVWARVREEITIAWQTEEHPRQRLTVADEREHVLFHLIEIIYRIVPAFYEEIESALTKVFGTAAGTIVMPRILDFGSWVGGDMDGNPDVHAKTIRETLARHHQLIVSTYFSDVQKLAAKLSQSASRVTISPALQKRIEEYSALLPAAQLTTPARHDRMPYRVFLGQVAERLRNTYDGKPNHYDTAAQLAADIGLVAESLAANKGARAGLHPVRRLLRRIATFGFHLASLDVRQHTEVHHEVLMQGLGDAQWLERTPAERAARLREVLRRDQGPSAPLDAVGKRTLWVFEAMQQCRHKYGRNAIGSYIISGAAGVDDVLAVLVLARWAEVIEKSGEVPIDIAPLFESVDSLEGSGAVLRELLQEEIYLQHLEARGYQQVVLLGYSDSNKESGPAAARWATHRAQADLVGAVAGTKVKLTLFHGRGGTIARGGGRIDALVHSAPPGAVTGRLRVTEQGEVVNQSYGLRPIAMRSFERAFNALALSAGSGITRSLASTHGAAAAAETAPDFQQAANLLGRLSRQTYRALVFEQPDFHRYFRESTPIDAIERMQIGSRPASRGEREGLEHLRAIPWVFAWTQTRAMLPGWYGVGTGLKAAVSEFGLERLREMRRSWFFFGVLLDDVETMLARADLEIAAQYDELAQAPLRRYFSSLRTEFALTRELVLAIKEQAHLLDGDLTLQRSIKLRNPYVDPMHLMQIDLLKRWRRTGRKDAELFNALLASISGIAQGLQSTG
ncbi:MAG TPA: phosphoenolpyruvate carboxylase [Steroidobacteraceae bacterium]|nr:phosphoenolpyruvate carboxylase [Steroidobacteraceae bacterium]